jgi:hypothetical protein
VKLFLEAVITSYFCLPAAGLFPVFLTYFLRLWCHLRVARFPHCPSIVANRGSSGPGAALPYPVFSFVSRHWGYLAPKFT